MVDTATGKKTALTPRVEGGEKAAYSEAKFAYDGKGILVLTDQGHEFQYLAYLPVDGGNPAELWLEIGHDITDFTVSKDGNRLAFVTNENGWSTLRICDILRRTLNEFQSATPPVPRLEGDVTGWLSTRTNLVIPSTHPDYIRDNPAPTGVISGLKWTPDGSLLGVSIGGARIPSDCFTTNTIGNFKRWTFSETGGVPPESFSEPKLVKWPSFDQKEISGFLYAPDAAKFPGKRPVIVNIHGGPESQYRPGFLGRTNYFINELGCAVIFPNVRGSSGYGKTFVGLDNGFKREDSYKDIDALLDWIKTQPDLDAERIMITGGSYGGHMTLAVSTFYADKIRCSVDVVGMSNLRTFLEHTESYRRDLRRVEYGDERDPKMAEFLDRIAPLNNAQKITRPMFVVQGYNDPRVPRSEAEQIVATLKKQGTPVWFLMAKDEGHGFAKKKNADFQFYATVEFIRRYLLN